MNLLRCHVEVVFDGCDVYNAAREFAEIVRRANAQHVLAAKLCNDFARSDNCINFENHRVENREENAQ